MRNFYICRREVIRDKILMFLGAPVQTVELDENNIDFCIAKSRNLLDGKRINPTQSYTDVVIHGAYKYAALMLARIRNKYVTSESVQAIRDAQKELDEWVNIVKTHG